MSSTPRSPAPLDFGGIRDFFQNQSGTQLGFTSKNTVILTGPINTRQTAFRTAKALLRRNGTGGNRGYRDFFLCSLRCLLFNLSGGTH